MAFENHNGFCVRGKNVLCFWSGAKTPPDLALSRSHSDFLASAPTKLTNFSESYIDVILGGQRRRFPSSEHLYQACKALPEHAEEFCVSSPIGELTEKGFVFAGAKPEKAAAKVKFWSRTRAVGILAKMRIEMLKKQGATRSLSGEECYRVFKQILIAKFVQDPFARAALEATGDAYLLEFVRSAGMDGKNELWGGIEKDGYIIGNNQMGALIMEVREILAKLSDDEWPTTLPRFEDLCPESRKRARDE